MVYFKCNYPFKNVKLIGTIQKDLSDFSEIKTLKYRLGHNFLNEYFLVHNDCN